MDVTTLTQALPIRHKNEPCCAPAEAPRLTQAQTAALAELLRVVGDTTRLRLLDLLAQQREPLCVCDITPQFAQNQPTISHHLKALREAGLIETGKQGIWAYYWATERGRALLDTLAALA
jgi:ArsR family transcriptional regulator